MDKLVFDGTSFTRRDQNLYQVSAQDRSRVLFLSTRVMRNCTNNKEELVDSKDRNEAENLSAKDVHRNQVLTLL